MCHHNETVLGKSRKYYKPEISEAFLDLKARYRSLIFEYSLKPEILDSVEDRINSARDLGRDPEKFLKEEEEAYRELENKVVTKSHQAAMQEEARRRRLAGESFADKILSEYQERIKEYPSLDFHEDADYEVVKLYGALDALDKNHWTALLNFLRKAFPGAGQLDRMSMEQRFWRLVSTRQGRIPDELEPYRRALSSPAATEKERVREAQEAIKQAAFFLHEFLDLCEKGHAKTPINEDVEDAVAYIRSIILDFRLRDLKRR